MTTRSTHEFFNGWRIAGWGAALALLLLPLLAMQVTAEVDWTRSDFIFAAVLIGALGAMIEFALRFRAGTGRRTGLVLFGLVSFLTVWSNAAVGIIGDEESRVNPYFFLAVFAAVVLSALVRFRPKPMALIAAGMAVTQFGLGVAASVLMPGHAIEWGILTFLALIWSASAMFLGRAARSGQSEA